MSDSRREMNLPRDWYFPDAPADYDGYDILSGDDTVEEPDGER